VDWGVGVWNCHLVVWSDARDALRVWGRFTVTPNAQHFMAAFNRGAGECLLAQVKGTAAAQDVLGGGQRGGGCKAVWHTVCRSKSNRVAAARELIIRHSVRKACPHLVGCAAAAAAAVYLQVADRVQRYIRRSVTNVQTLQRYLAK